MSKRPTYLSAVVASLATMFKGMKLSGKHFFKGHHRAEPLGIADPEYFAKTQGPITIQYPMQKVPVPDNGRYRLFMETEDCIGCDKCARICPVDCITIETFRADGDLGRTSDGTVKRLHLPTFDIDMGKCMYCGLCTTVCPTECLVMTPVYDFSEYDRDNFVYHFGAYSPTEDSRIRLETETALAAKKAAKSAATPSEQASEEKPKGRTMMRPVMKPTESAEILPENQSAEEQPKPRPRPMMKRKEVPETQTPPIEEKTDSPESPAAENTPPRPRPRPLMKRKEDIASSEEAQIIPESPTPEIKDESPEEPPKPKPRSRPIMRPPANKEGGAEE